MTKLGELRHLGGSGGALPMRGLKHLAALKLQQLDIASCGKITNEGLKHLAKLGELRELKLAYGITNEGLKHLAGLKLQLLDLSHCDKITNEGLKGLEGLKQIEGPMEIWPAFNGVFVGSRRNRF